VNWGERVAGQKPRQGWIYFINPYRVSLRCKRGHDHIYEINQAGEIECQTSDLLRLSLFTTSTHRPND